MAASDVPANKPSEFNTGAPKRLSLRSRYTSAVNAESSTGSAPFNELSLRSIVLKHTISHANDRVPGCDNGNSGNRGTESSSVLTSS